MHRQKSTKKAADSASASSQAFTLPPQYAQLNSHELLTLGRVYEEGEDEHLTNPQLAAQLYKESSSLGNQDATLALAQCHEFGIGVGEDEKKADQMYRMLDQAGHAPTQLHLAKIHRHQAIAEQERKQVFTWVQKSSATLGDGEADFLLGWCYEHACGTVKDDKQAAVHYRISAEEDNPMGLYALARCYQQGIGVEVDHKEFLNLYQRIIAHATKLGRFEPLLTEEDLVDSFSAAPPFNEDAPAPQASSSSSSSLQPHPTQQHFQQPQSAEAEDAEDEENVEDGEEKNPEAKDEAKLLQSGRATHAATAQSPSKRTRPRTPAPHLTLPDPRVTFHAVPRVTFHAVPRVPFHTYKRAKTSSFGHPGTSDPHFLTTLPSLLQSSLTSSSSPLLFVGGMMPLSGGATFMTDTTSARAQQTGHTHVFMAESGAPAGTPQTAGDPDPLLSSSLYRAPTLTNGSSFPVRPAAPSLTAPSAATNPYGSFQQGGALATGSQYPQLQTPTPAQLQETGEETGEEQQQHSSSFGFTPPGLGQ